MGAIRLSIVNTGVGHGNRPTPPKTREACALFYLDDKSPAPLQGRDERTNISACNLHIIKTPRRVVRVEFINGTSRGEAEAATSL